MGTIDSEIEIVNYLTENYQYCTGIESNKIVAANIDLDQVLQDWKRKYCYGKYWWVVVQLFKVNLSTNTENYWQEGGMFTWSGRNTQKENKMGEGTYKWKCGITLD